MSVSLDGFIADPHDEVGPLFDWYRMGPVTTPSASEEWSFKTDEASAEQLRKALSTIGALICGRRLFDLTKAWGGRPVPGGAYRPYGLITARCGGQTG